MVIMSEPTIPESASSPEPDDSSLPNLGLSQRQILLILAFVVVAGVFYWRFKKSDEPETGDGSIEELEKAISDDLAGEVTFDDEGGAIEVPTDPTDELEKDEAVLEGLKASGKMFGGS